MCGRRLTATLFWCGVTVAVLGLCLSSRADLEWKERRLALEPPVGAANAVGVFEFVNRGKNPVRIVNVRSDCGCTAMASENEVVHPGAKGSVRAVFHVGSRKGKQTVAVSVTTEEPELREYTLALEVAVKDFATITPGFVDWKLGDQPEAKTFEIRLADDFRFLGAECTTRDFAVEVAGKAGAALQLRVVPRDTWAKRTGTIKIMVAQGDQPPVEVLAFARVL